MSSYYRLSNISNIHAVKHLGSPTFGESGELIGLKSLAFNKFGTSSKRFIDNSKDFYDLYLEMASQRTELLSG